MKNRLGLVSLSLSMLLSSLGTSIANVALPTLAGAFGISFQEVQWIVLAYLLAITTFVVSAGRLGDIVGRRRLLLVGMAVFAAASALCGLAPSFWVLVAGRVAQGLGAAIMMALTLALLGETVPKGRTGAAMGLIGAISAIGTALGASFGGALIAFLGWRSIFLVMLPLGVLALVLAWRCLPSDGKTYAALQGFDLKGTVLLALTLAAYALSMTIGRGRFGAVNVLLLAGAALGIVLFKRVEASAPSPLIRLAMFRNPVLRAGMVMSALVTTVVMATLVVGPFYLSGTLGLDAAGVGLVMSCGPVTAALSGVPAGRAVDRLGARGMTFVGLIAMAIGCAVLPIIPAGVAGYIASLVVITAGYALFQAANNTAVLADVAPEQRGVISGMLNLSRNLGLITGASLMGAIYFAGGMVLTFGVAAALIVCALIVGAAGGAPRLAST